MAGIFINYRRDDAPGVAGRLFDHLAPKFARGSLFMDVDAMRPGVDFARHLDSQVSQCQVLLAVIGPRWLDARDQAGKRRLDADNDYVRIELAAALKRDIPVIPILVDGAAMPSEDSLSDDLKPLARRHALELRHTRFNADADAIVHALETVVPLRRAWWALVGGGVAVVVVIAVMALVFWHKFAAQPSTQPAVVAAKPASVAPPAANAPPPSVAPPSVSPPSLTPAIAVPSPAPPSDAAPPGELPPGIKLGEMMSGIALPGSILRVIEVPADPVSCQSACRAEMRCAAWTYTQPPAQGQPAHCSLKPLIPGQRSEICCTSGVERVPEADFRQPPPVPADVVGALSGIDMGGLNSRTLFGAEATPEACQAACRADGQCLAWTYVRPGISSADSRCNLKSKSPIQLASPCCISGIERQAAASDAPAVTVPTPGSGPLFNTDLFGADYRRVDLPSDDWTQCQSACKADSHCLAWSIVRPGVQAPNARCWLKNRIPQPTANLCCTSGVERAAAQ